MVMLFDKSEYQIFHEARLAKENKFLIFVSSYFLSMIFILILVLHLNLKFYYFFNYLNDLDFLYCNYIFNYLLPSSNFNIINLQIVSDVHAIGLVLYTDYFFPFILAGFGLLIAMIGAILITRNVYTRIIDKSKRKLQSSEQQLARISSKFIKK
jgi:NADH:ubiquinone oxidoreductase subunit 6 (subunit J)